MRSNSYHLLIYLLMYFTYIYTVFIIFYYIIIIKYLHVESNVSSLQKQYMIHHYLLPKRHPQTRRFHAKCILPAHIGASIFVFLVHFDIIHLPKVSHSHKTTLLRTDERTKHLALLSQLYARPFKLKCWNFPLKRRVIFFRISSAIRSASQPHDRLQ